MRRSYELKSPKRKCHTQQAQTYYPQHLLLKKKHIFQKYIKNPQIAEQKRSCQFFQMTNFNFPISNQYLYILLHLRSKSNKNILNIKIPQVCIFLDKTPYDIVYSQNGFIRGRNLDAKLRLRDLEESFRDVWKAKALPKGEHVSAVFQDKEVLLMSQTDFTISCKKIKSDPFFKKLLYIQNKTPSIGTVLAIYYDCNIKQDKILKLATQSLLGNKKQKQILDQLGQDKYLSFLNQKITLVLNYHHNIRTTKACFHYVKNQENQYFLINVTNLKVTNLTQALKKRQEKLKKQQDRMCQLLNLTPQKQKRYKSFENPIEIKRYETAMSSNFDYLVEKMNMKKIFQAKDEQIKSQLAFKRLHPQITLNYKQLITTVDFKKTKQKLFGSTISNRKRISIPSKFVLRSYNKTKRCTTLFAEISSLE